MMRIQVDVEPSPDEVTDEIRDAMEKSARTSHVKTLNQITRIMTYTLSGNPHQPSGSTYRRTFALSRSYKFEILRNRWPVITSQWKAVAKHAKYVIGKLKQQARIHRNRWRDLETLTKEVNVIHEQFTREDISRNLPD